MLLHIGSVHHEVSKWHHSQSQSLCCTCSTTACRHGTRRSWRSVSLLRICLHIALLWGLRWQRGKVHQLSLKKYFSWNLFQYLSLRWQSWGSLYGIVASCLKPLENEILLSFYSPSVSFPMSERALLPHKQDPREGVQLVDHILHGVDLIPIRASGQALRALMGQGQG